MSKHYFWQITENDKLTLILILLAWLICKCYELASSSFWFMATFEAERSRCLCGYFCCFKHCWKLIHFDKHQMKRVFCCPRYLLEQPVFPKKWKVPKNCTVPLARKFSLVLPYKWKVLNWYGLLCFIYHIKASQHLDHPILRPLQAFILIALSVTNH